MENRRPLRDSIGSAGSTAGFSLATGIATVAVPLLAIQAGYSGAVIGALTALSALTQIMTRLCMAAGMRRFPDWVFITASAALMVASNGLLALSAALVPFILAQAVQGAARAFFWTASQAHVVRVASSSVRALAMLNLASSAGLVGGPIIAGLLTELSVRFALALGSGIAAITIVPTVLLLRLPPFAPPDGSRPARIWRRPGVDAGCAGAVTVGAWRGLLGSYVPVVLEAARLSPAAIGILVSFANVAQLAGAGMASRVRSHRLSLAHALGILAASLGTAAVGPLTALTWAAGVALTVSGVGAGALQTISPAVASDAVGPQEKGDAIAVAGTFRAAALFLAPLSVAGLVVVMPVAWAMLTAGLVMGCPIGFSSRLRRHLSDVAASAHDPPSPGP